MANYPGYLNSWIIVLSIDLLPGLISHVSMRMKIPQIPVELKTLKLFENFDVAQLPSKFLLTKYLEIFRKTLLTCHKTLPPALKIGHLSSKFVYQKLIIRSGFPAQQKSGAWRHVLSTDVPFDKAVQVLNPSNFFVHRTSALDEQVAKGVVVWRQIFVRFHNSLKESEFGVQKCSDTNA